MRGPYDHLQDIAYQKLSRKERERGRIADRAIAKQERMILSGCSPLL